MLFGGRREDFELEELRMFYETCMLREDTETYRSRSPYTVSILAVLLATLKDTLVAVNRDPKKKLKEEDMMVQFFLRETQEKKLRKERRDAEAKARFLKHEAAKQAKEVNKNVQ